MTNPSWHITNAHREVDDGYVYRVEYKITAAAFNYNVSRFSEIDLPRPETTLLPFSQLTEDQLISWVQRRLGSEHVSTIETELSARLKDKQSKPITASGVPWSMPMPAAELPAVLPSEQPTLCSDELEVSISEPKYQTIVDQEIAVIEGATITDAIVFTAPEAAEP